MILLKGAPVVEEYKKEIRSSLILLKKKPKLVIIETNNGCDSSFIKGKLELAREVGIGVRCKLYKGEKKGFRKWLNSIEKQKNNNGIIIQLPIREDLLPKTQYFLESISEMKDIDCLGEKCLGRLLSNRMLIMPPVVEAVFALMKHYKIDFVNKNVAVLGRGRLVGKPLTVALMNTGANIINPKMPNAMIKHFTKKSDIIITGIGKPDEFLIKGDMVKDGVVIIDVGWGRKFGRIYGDTDLESVKNKAFAVTPVPGGIGKVTIAVLLKNLIKLNIDTTLQNQISITDCPKTRL